MESTDLPFLSKVQPLPLQHVMLSDQNECHVGYHAHDLRETGTSIAIAMEKRILVDDIQSNTDVYNYLVLLRNTLASNGQSDLAEIIATAVDERFATGAEFLGACHFSLRLFLKNGRMKLDSGTIADAEQLLSQIRSTCGSQRIPLE